MQTMKRGFLTDGQVDFADPKCIISDYATVKVIHTSPKFNSSLSIILTGIPFLQRIDIGNTTTAQLDFESPFRLTINREGRINALCGWFDTFFDGEDEDGNGLEKVFFSTGPAVKGTHWKQTMFAFEPAVDVVVGAFACCVVL